MPNLQKIRRCLISVSDKTNIVELAKYLAENNVEIISTGGTSKILSQNNIKNIDISDFTNFPEMMDGRIKTLHPKVHAALLAISDNADHQKSISDHQIQLIDLLIVNLYPFSQTVDRIYQNYSEEEIEKDPELKEKTSQEIIENIDIGGPAMIRSAAKNFAFKTLITAVDQYQDLIDEMKKNDLSTSFDFRKKMAAAAFDNIAKYDNSIASWFNRDNFYLTGELKQKLRYGENSHQKAALYSNSNSGIVNAVQIQGKELSYNNLNDADAAYNLVMEFEKAACVIVKHANPCGVSIADDILTAYNKALSADAKSAFGGIVAINSIIDEKLAIEISKMFYEVIIAKEISQKAKEILSAKKNLRVLIADFKGNSAQQIKSISGGFLVQDFDDKNFTADDIELVSNFKASDEKIDQLIFGMKICKNVKSNAIVVADDFQTLGIGAGQMSRVDSVMIACKKASEFNQNGEIIDRAKNSVMASDAFFPFADNIEIAAQFGISAIISPRGSVKDQEVIDKANEKKISLYFINSRHFKH
jgi:phosphoribosylaminoimidazolecarboxamide formyltransferase/IMP cyclohydrolase